MLFCGKTNESKTNEFSMSFEVELTTVTEADHVERGAEVYATGAVSYTHLTLPTNREV